MSRLRSPAALDLLLLAALGVLPLAAALAGARVPDGHVVEMNLGPGDSPYVSGFTPSHEVDDAVGTHWTTYHAAIAWPLVVQGTAAELSYRFSRVFPQTALVEVRLGERAVDRFTARGGLVQEKTAQVGPLAPTPLVLRFIVDSHEKRDLGLKMDWVRVRLTGGHLRLAGRARWRALFLVAVLFVLSRAGGLDRKQSAALTAPWAIAAAAGLSTAPWLTHRLLTGVPEALLLFGTLGVGLGRLFASRGRLSAPDLRALTALGTTAFLLRAVAINHPDFYYPDLMTHARLVESLRTAGLDFLRAPAEYVGAQGAWTKPAYGLSSGLPYTPAFHLVFALLPLGFDAVQQAFKLAGAALTIVPLVGVWVLARRLEASPLGAVLMVFVPTYTSRLSFALLPALFGHAADVLVLVWLAHHLAHVRTPRVFLAGAVLFAACQLAYVSSVVNMALFLGAFALLVAAQGDPGSREQGLALLGLGLAGSLLAVAAYYRDFLGAAAALAPRVVGEGSASRYPVESWLGLTYARTRDFFDGVYPLLAAAGCWLLARRGLARSLVGAWAATYLLLLLLRAKVPDVFRYGHETLFVTPLVCLASGEALARLGTRGRWGKVAAGLLLVFLAVQGALWQWNAVADQLGNAR